MKPKREGVETLEDLQDTLAGLKERLQTNQKNFVYLAVGVLLAVTLVVAGYAYYSYTSSKSKELLADAQSIYFGMKPSASPSERLQKSLELFKKSYETKSSPSALLYIANIQAELGNTDEAIKTLLEMKSKYSDSFPASMASLRLAYLYLKKGDTESALKAFADVSAKKNGPFADIALQESYQILKSQGKTAEAEAKLKELSERFPKPAGTAPSDNQSK